MEGAVEVGGCRARASSGDAVASRMCLSSAKVHGDGLVGEHDLRVPGEAVLSKAKASVELKREALVHDSEEEGAADDEETRELVVA